MSIFIWTSELFKNQEPPLTCWASTSSTIHSVTAAFLWVNRTLPCIGSDQMFTRLEKPAAPKAWVNSDVSHGVPRGLDVMKLLESGFHKSQDCRVSLEVSLTRRKLKLSPALFLYRRAMFPGERDREGGRKESQSMLCRPPLSLSSFSGANVK